MRFQGVILGPLPYTNYSLGFTFDKTFASQEALQGVAILSFNFTSDDYDMCARGLFVACCLHLCTLF